MASRRCYVVEVMGRDCGYLALMGGMATGAEQVHMPEDGIALDDLRADVAELVHGFSHGKRLGLIVRCEGADPFYTTDFLVTLFAKESRGLYDVRRCVLGHTQQGGRPSPSIASRPRASPRARSTTSSSSRPAISPRPWASAAWAGKSSSPASRISRTWSSRMPSGRASSPGARSSRSPAAWRATRRTSRPRRDRIAPRASAHSSRRTRWISCTQIEPSPTAEATRLTLPERASPTANTPGRAGLQQVGARGQRPAGLVELVGPEIGAGLDEVLVVERQAALEPGGVRIGAGHQEHVADRARLAPRRCRGDASGPARGGPVPSSASIWVRVRSVTLACPRCAG